MEGAKGIGSMKGCVQSIKHSVCGMKRLVLLYEFIVERHYPLVWQPSRGALLGKRP